MSEQKEINTFRTEEVVCPHCGSENDDAWREGEEIFSDTRKLICGNCDQKFIASINRIITFTSYTEEEWEE